MSFILSCGRKLSPKRSTEFISKIILVLVTENSTQYEGLMLSTGVTDDFMILFNVDSSFELLVDYDKTFSVIK